MIRRAQKQPSDKRIRSATKHASLAIATGLLCLSFAAGDELAEAPSVPVKTINTVASAETETMMADRQAAQAVPQPTTPAAKLPQYQLGHLRRAVSLANPDDPRVRLVLALADRPIILDAVITVDEKPFRQLRETRVVEILTALETPQPASDLEPESTTVEPTEEPTAPPFIEASSVTERIRRYAMATGTKPTAAEVHWQLTNWIDGPVLLFLNDSFQRFRADQMPVFKILDRDHDGNVSEAELKLAQQSFKECDLNNDDLVARSEMAEVASDPRDTVRHAGTSQLLFHLPDLASAPTYRRLAARYRTDNAAGNADNGDSVREIVPRFDTNSNGTLEPDEFKQLAQTQPDVLLTITFRSKTSDSQLAITSIGGTLNSEQAMKSVVVNPQSLTLPINNSRVEFSAIQNTQSDQISIGAVNDGYPILPEIDPNNDGRWTIRELRKLDSLLAKFDANEDGQLSKSENRSPIRVCFGLGPGIDRELAMLRSQPGSTGDATAAPEWFSQMDTNRDGDLTRREFPGTDEQFHSLDADSDKLVSVAEAIEFQTSKPDSDE